MKKQQRNAGILTEHLNLRRSGHRMSSQLWELLDGVAGTHHSQLQCQLRQN
jgi:hypothetical protein